MRPWLLGLAMACATSCSTGDDLDDMGHRSDRGAAAYGGRVDLDADTDGDGVCDATEEAYGSDIETPDSDRDGLPDLTELVANFEPSDPASPNADQIGYIAGAPQAALDFVLRMTVEGSGLGYSGEFRDFETIDAFGLTAKDFYEGAVALGGDPPDNVRGIQEESEHFSAVLGRTRLSFMLRFQVRTTKLSNCTMAYPFQYRLKATDGKYVASRDYLLIVTHDESGERPKFCLPPTCL